MEANMRTLRSTLIATLVASTAILPRFASATITAQHLPSDEQLAAALPSAKTAFVAQGRIGDRGGKTGFEAGIGPDMANPAATGQHDWQKGVPEPFTLVYNTERKIVLFAVGNNSLLFTPQASVPLTDMFIRVQSQSAGATVRLSDLVIRSAGVPDACETSGAEGRDILWIRGADIANGFLMTGFLTIGWEGTAPTGSQIEFQICAGEAVALPATPAAPAQDVIVRREPIPAPAK
jgi:hypothetical protein